VQVRDTGEKIGRVVEAVPAGILVIDSFGVITFANGVAREMLGLHEDPTLGSYPSPGWTVRVSDRSSQRGADRPDLRDLLAPEPAVDVGVVITWPDGLRRRFAANTAPAAAADGRVSGAVVAFLEREPWLRSEH